MSKRPSQKTTPPAGAHYPIRAVSKLTGLGIDTLRAWERRHHAVTPRRDDRGRLYTDVDIDRFRLLRDAVAAGHSIGRVAALDADTLRHLAGRDAVSVAPPSGGPRASRVRPPADELAVLLEAARAFDGDRLEADLGRAAALLQPLEFLETVLGPFLQQVGEEWHAGRLTVGQEHFASGLVRGVLSSMLRAQPRQRTNRLLFATPPGEPHEFGILGAALLAAHRGIGALYLGPDLPAKDMIASAESAGVSVVVIGLTVSRPGTPTAAALTSVSRRLPPSVELWLGGPSAPQLAAVAGPRAVVLTTFDTFERELARFDVRSLSR